MKAQTRPTSLSSIATAYNLNPKEFEKQYKDHLSDFHTWNQKEHAEEWIINSENTGAHLSIDEVAISNGELYTIITNKAAHGKKGAIVGMFQGTDASKISSKLDVIEQGFKNIVTEATLDMSPAMEAIIRRTFPNARLVTDRFHVGQLVSEVVQEVRMSFRREALKEENKKLKEAKKNKVRYIPTTYSNGDTKKQLLARSRYLLFKPKSKWHGSQKERADILFKEFPKIEKAYKLSMMFRNCYESSKDEIEAKEKFDNWYEKVEESKLEEFAIPSDTIQAHEDTILNYFVNRSTNASAESFNAKLKNFRSLVRGVTDKKFFLYRINEIFG